MLADRLKKTLATLLTLTIETSLPKSKKLVLGVVDGSGGNDNYIRFKVVGYQINGDQSDAASSW